ncbi:MAG: hypothetical protein V4692_00595 [Bdellovibrionota bacterium]
MTSVDFAASILVSFIAASPASAQTPTPVRSVAFETIVGTSEKILFYRTETTVDVHLAIEKKPEGFKLKADDSIVPGGLVKFPPTSIFELIRESGNQSEMWKSSLCFPQKISKSMNVYFESMTCDEAKGACEIDFGKNLGDQTKKSVPFFRMKDGSFQITSKHLALALVGSVPNKTDEFKDLTSKDLRFGRIAVSGLTCSSATVGIVTCSMSVEKDQNPFPRERPWDDCR